MNSHSLTSLLQPTIPDTTSLTSVNRRPVPRRKVYCILGLPFDAVDRKQVIARIQEAILKRTRLFITTPNTNNLIASRRDVPFRNSFLRSDLAIPDGMPIVWIAKLLGLPVRERLAGANLFEDLRRGEAGPVRIYIFGGPDGAAKKAHEKINFESGPMTSVGWCSPGFGTLADMSSARIIDEINRTKPDLVLAALGSQKGQAWVERNRAALDAPVIMHLGAVVNFAAGTLQRAPNYVQNAGFEWAWRIKEEPTLWRRYWKDACALFTLLAHHLVPLMRSEMQARRLRSEESSVHFAREADVSRIALGGSITGAALSLAPHLADLYQHLDDVEIDLAKAGPFDSAAVGWLMNLYGRQSNGGRGFRVTTAGDAARRSLALHRAEFIVDEPLTARMASSTEAPGRTPDGP